MTPNWTSSSMQLSTSSRMRPNVCMITSVSKVSSGRAQRKRRMPARSGDCTSPLNRVSMSNSGFCDPALARRAAKVTSSTGHLGVSAFAEGDGGLLGGRAVILGLVLLDQLLHAHGVGLAMAVAAHRGGAAAGLDDHVRKQQVGINAHGCHMRDMDRMFFSADQL